MRRKSLHDKENWVSFVGYVKFDQTIIMLIYFTLKWLESNIRNSKVDSAGKDVGLQNTLER